ncbi:hypothetical protein EDC04DRAFT_3117797 [Pisolithus marmoratus]|nr:hypothetical protein EDC04DRAFT_3117797 [Pisolithus marmoratus]
MESPAMAFEHQSSEGKLHHTSPLETLVRRTSSRRHHAGHSQPRTRGDVHQATTTVPSPVPHYPVPRPSLGSPPRPFASQSMPDSPLLHSNFRSSTASATTNASVLQYYMGQHSKSSFDEPDEAIYYYDDNSLVYGEREQAYIIPGSHTRPANRTPQNPGPQMTNSSSQPILPSTADRQDSPEAKPRTSSSSVPTVVVSTPENDVDPLPSPPSRQPIVSNSSPRLNFSRPGRPPILSSDEQKRQVLARNSQRPNSPRTTQCQSSHLPLVPITGTRYSAHRLSDEPHSANGGLSTSVHPGPSPSPSSQVSAGSGYLHSHPPVLRPGSATTTRSIPFQDHRSEPTMTHSLSPNPPNPKPNQLSDNSPSTGPQTPFDYLQLGIQYHESNRLKDSARYFEKSATEQGGCGVGMLMWGLALRHGWGCEKNEKSGFKWLAKAAESAVADLERARQGRGFDAKAVKEELVIAIYEVGQCFFQGWGVRKDQKMAVSYYRVAASLGDVDAQQDLAFCLANGRGCKRDKKEAAKWYRDAVAQGASDVGMAWIYKDKYKG